MPVYQNITLVDDWRCPPGGSVSGSGCCDGSCSPDPLYNASGIAPYGRLSHVQDCNGTNYWCADQAGSPWCGPWQSNIATAPYGWINCSGAGVTVQGYNCFKATGATTNLGVCRKLGFKNIQYWKAWHGKFGYASHDNPASQINLQRSVQFGSFSCPSISSYANICNGHDIEYEQTSPDGTRYLTESATAVYSIVADTTGGATLVRTSSIDRYSGVETRACSDSGDSPSQLNCHFLLQSVLLGSGGGYCPSGCAGSADDSWFTGMVQGVGYAPFVLCVVQAHVGNVNSGGCSGIPVCTYDSTTTHSGTQVEFYAYFTAVGSMFPGQVAYHVIADATTGSLQFEAYGAGADGITYTQIYDETVTIVSNTQIGHHLEVWGPASTMGPGSFTGWGHETWDCTQTLSTPYTSANVNTDCVTLRGQWDLSDDLLYPWRTDALVGVAPILHYNEVTPARQPAAGADCYTDWPTNSTPWVDVNAATYDGSIIGKPVPLHGLARGYFDWTHRSWKCCCSPAADSFLYATGMFAGENFENDSTPNVVPKASTNWSENISQLGVIDASQCAGGGAGCADGWCVGYAPAQYQPASGGPSYSPFPVSYNCGSLPAGAYRFYHPVGNVLFCQDWMEVKLPRPSVNFARPFGPDRYAVDETTVRCIQSGASTGSLNIDSATGINTGDLVWICGCSGITTGVYTATKNTATNYSVTAAAWSSSYTYANDCNSLGGNGIIGKLRFPTAPGIGGRIGIAAIDAAGNVTLTAPAWLQVGDLLDISGCTGNTALNGTSIAVTSVADATHFSTGIAQSPGAYTGGGIVISHGAASYVWDDDQGKGQFGYATWTMNCRDYQERNRVVDQYTASGSCADAAPASTALIRQYQYAYHGMPQAVTDNTIYQECIPFDVCNPQAMVISANASETWANACVNVPPSLTLDGRYGAMWQAAFVQTVDDPFWQTPHTPCVTCSGANGPSGCCWAPDDGACEADTCSSDCSTCSAGNGFRFYPFPPQTEYIGAVPVGAPSLPSGVYVGYVAVASLNTTSSVSGNVYLPPVAQGYYDCSVHKACEPIPVLTPWQVYISQMQCVCAGDRFSPQYADNGVKVNCP